MGKVVQFPNKEDRLLWNTLRETIPYMQQYPERYKVALLMERKLQRELMAKYG